MQNFHRSRELTAMVWYFRRLPNMARTASAISALVIYVYIVENGHAQLLSVTTSATGAQKSSMKNNQ